MAVLVSDKKLDHFCLSQNFSSVNQNNLVFHPGKVSPPGGDGSTLKYRIDTSQTFTVRVIKSRNFLPRHLAKEFFEILASVGYISEVKIPKTRKRV